SRLELRDLGGELRLLVSQLVLARLEPDDLRVQLSVALPLVAQLALRDAVAVVPERDLRPHPVEHAREARVRAPRRVALEDPAARVLERARPGGDVARVRVAGLGLEDAVLAGHRAKMAERRFGREANQEVPVLG